MGQIDLGRPGLSAPLQAHPEFVAGAGVVEGTERAAEEVTDEIGGNAGPVLGPFGLHDADARIFQLHQPTVGDPEIADHRPDIVHRILHQQPFLAAVAQHPDLVRLRQNLAPTRRTQRRGDGPTTLAGVVGKAGRTAGRRPQIGDHHVVVNARGGQVRRHFQIRRRTGLFVFHDLVAGGVAHPLFDGSTTGRQT